MVTPSDLMYIAGFFDGEGSISIGRRGRVNGRWLQLLVSITNTDRDVLEMIRATFGFGVICLKDAGRPTRERLRRLAYGTRDCYELIWNSRQAESVVRELYPYLRVKKGQAEIALRFRSTFGQKWSRHTVPPDVLETRETDKRQLTELNKGGIR